MSLSDSTATTPFWLTLPPADDKWNATAIDLLRRLINERLTTTQIAIQLSRATGEHFTRNAIIGKARRLNIALLSGAKTAPHQNAKPKKPPKPSPNRIIKMIPAPSIAPPKITLEEVVANPLKLSILDIKRGQCYWPVETGDDRGHVLFCGHATGGHQASWCAAHRKIGYAKPWERTVREVPMR